MFEIAGGILLALAILVILPLIFTVTIWSVSIILVLIILGFIGYFIYSELIPLLLIVAILAFAYIFYTGIATLFGNKNDFIIKSSKSTLLIASIIFLIAVLLLNSLITDKNASKQTTSENLSITQTKQFTLPPECFEIIKKHKLCKEQNINCDEANSIAEANPLTFFVCITGQ